MKVKLKHLFAETFPDLKHTHDADCDWECHLLKDIFSFIDEYFKPKDL